MAAKIEPKTRTLARPTDWNMIEAAGENMLDRFRQDLRDIGLEIDLFPSRMGNLWGVPFPRMTLPTWTTWKEVTTPLDLEDMGTGYQVRMNLPGVPKELVGIKFLDQTLEIEAETKAVKETEKKNYVLHERKEAEFYRRVNFPTPIAPEKAEAKLDHGVLSVTVPKLKPAKELKVPLS